MEVKQRMKVIGREQRPQSRSETQSLRMIVTRSPRDVVVEVPVPDGWAPDLDSQ